MHFLEEDIYKNNSGIYKIRQVSSGLLYIGQTKMKFIKRYWHHVWKLKNNVHDNRHLQNAWNKYGADDFIFEIVQVVPKNEDMNNLECEYIKQFNSFTKGFNMTTGGEGKKNCPMSDYAKKIVGEKNRIHNLGKKASDETKVKMSKTRTGKKLSEFHKEKLRMGRLGYKCTESHKQKVREANMGSKSPVAVINESIASEIKTRLIKGQSVNDIAESLNVNHGIIRSILSSRVWNHIQVEGWDEYLTLYNLSKQKLLSDDEVRHIRLLLKQNITAWNISKMLNIGYSVISGIKQQRTYKNII